MIKYLLALILFVLFNSNVAAALWPDVCFDFENLTIDQFEATSNPVCSGIFEDPDPYPSSIGPSQPTVQIFNVDDLYYLILSVSMVWAFSSGIATGSDFS